ncbi:MFS transporter [Actinomadura logoneensis]|uniref:MFS transporter n=1 Tax=Actinomadura logoneensis TaxID=2293572 RepID=A0A372J995_9ACTN|nr:MFS transporter [Actinomadura logoneensis]RFU36572.1 MFS transporter [Actinomadura logoneensis]
MTVTLTAPPRPRRTGRDFRLFWIGETTSKIGSGVSGVAIPLAAVSVLHASTFQVGLLTAATWLPWLLVGLPAGAWVDRMPRRPLMVTCNLASTALLLSLPVSAWLGVLTFWQLAATALLTGVAGVFFQTAYQVYLPSLLDREDLAAGNARMQGSESFAQVAGPGLAGGITQALGVLGGLVADAASFAVSTLCLLGIRGEEEPVAPRERTSLGRDILTGLRFVTGDPYLRVFALFGAVFNLAFIAYQAVLVVFLIRDLGVREGVVGLLMMGISVGGVIGAAVATRVTERFGSARGLLVALFGTVPFALAIPLTEPGPRLAFLVVGGLMIGVGTVVSNVIRGSFRQLYTPRELLGRVSVSMMFLNFGTIPLGGLLGGVLGEAVGIRPTLWVMAVTMAASPLLLLVGPLRRGRDLPATGDA